MLVVLSIIAVRSSSVNNTYPNVYMYNKWAANSLMNTCVFQTGCVFIHTALQENHNGPFTWWHHLLLRPASFRVFLSCANYGFCHLNLAGITKFKYEKKNEKDSDSRSIMTPSSKWPIPGFQMAQISFLSGTVGFRYLQFNRNVLRHLYVKHLYSWRYW